MRVHMGWCLAVLAFLSASPTRVFGGETLNPYTRTSASGRSVLSVEPSNQYGVGLSRASLHRDGVELWACDYDITLWDAAVTDDGIVAGYAYAWGHHGGFPRDWKAGDPPPQDDGDVIWICIIDDKGTLRTQAPYQRNKSMYAMDPPPPQHPVVNGITLLEDQDAVVIRADEDVNGDTMLWWVYRLSTGEHICDAKPEVHEFPGMGFAKEIDAVHVPGTPFLAVHWYLWELGSDSAEIALVHYTGQNHWVKAFPDEYVGLGDNWNWWNLEREGIHQLAAEPGAISFTSLTSGLTTRFAWEPGNEANVTTTTSPGPPLRTQAKAQLVDPAALPEVEPKVLGRVTLRTPALAPSVLGEIFGFSVDDRGRMGWCRVDEGFVRFTLVDSDGTVVCDHPIEPMVRERTHPKAAWCAGDRWLIHDATYRPSVSRAWWLDVSTGATTPLTNLQAGSFENVAPLSDAGFVAIVRNSSEYTMSYALTAFDDTGRTRWTRALESGDGVAVTPDGTIAVAEGSVYDRIRFFDAAGEDICSTSIADCIGREPNYVAGLTSDLDGGFILHDFNGSPSIYRLTRDLAVRNECEPIYPDGSRFVNRAEIHSDPCGSLWVTDARALLRLDEKGVVTQVIGAAPSERPLEKISGMAIGPDGRVYAANAGNSAIHVFNDAGEPLSVLRPDPGDFQEAQPLTDIMVARDGCVYYKGGYRPGESQRPQYLKFGPDGSRIGFVETTNTECWSEDWCFYPSSDRRWQIGCRRLSIIEADGSVARVIDRRPDNNWIDAISDGAVAQDGSFAIISYSSSNSTGEPRSICTYGPTGEPGAVIPYIGHGFSKGMVFAPPLVAVSDQAGLFIYDTRSDRPPLKYKLPHVETRYDPYWYLYASSSPGEILLREANALELVRLRLPDP